MVYRRKTGEERTAGRGRRKKAGGKSAEISGAAGKSDYIGLRQLSHT